MKHISFTQINMLLRCPQQYEFRYIHGLKIPPKSAIAFGRATHRAIEEDNKEKLKNNRPLKLSTLQDIFVETLEQEPEILFDEGEDLASLKDEGAKKIIPLYCEVVSPKIEPLLVEDEFTIHFENVDYAVKGKIDLVDTKERIEEFKFVKRKPTQYEKPLPELQLSFYSLGYKIKKGRLPKGADKIYFVRNKEPKVFTEKEKRTLEDLNNLLFLISKAMQMIEKGIFLPNFNNVMCNPKSCGYFWHCKKKWTRKIVI